MSFEKLVRPFQKVVKTPPRYVPTSSEPSTDNVILSVGGSGEVKVYQLAYSLAVVRYMTKQEREVTREGA
jgi:hypothetical protein